MDLKQYLSLFRKWWWLVLLCAALAGLTAFVASRSKLPLYAARATTLLDTSRPSAAASTYNDIMTNEKLTEQYAALLTQNAAIKAVREQLDGAPKVYGVAVNPQRNTSIIDITVTAADPEAAAYIANHLPDYINEKQRQRQAERYVITRASLEEEMQTTEVQLNELRSALVQLDPENDDDKVEYATLNARLSAQERTFEQLRQNLFNLRLAEDQGSNILSIIEPAEVPSQPVGSGVLGDVLRALILGLILGVGTALFIEYLDDTIKSDGEVSERFGIGVLGMIGKITSGAGRRVLVSSLAHHSPIAEAYRILRTNIRFSAVDTPLHSIVVTSPGPGEGKSTTAANLAVVMAQAGNRTILVDADLRRPTQHGIFSVPNKEGLTTALVEHDRPATTYLQETGTPNLRLLTSGPHPPNPAELLGSQRMRELVDELKEEVDYVIIDTSPILAVTDSALLAGVTDGVLLVVRANQTRLDALGRAAAQLDGVQARLLGAVINDARAGQGSYYYYYYAPSTPEKGRSALLFSARMRTLLLNILPRKS